MAQVSRVLALDFDGVVCDSVGESALSAWKARAHARHRQDGAQHKVSTRRRSPVRASPRRAKPSVSACAQAGEALWPDLLKKASAAEKDRRGGFLSSLSLPPPFEGVAKQRKPRPGRLLAAGHIAAAQPPALQS